ncbi:IclR family transcriptional regulator [Roseibium litorale]|uniref:IclR family transcriptional regulator n=1 Tax=Roseibium litorale TaxID=2803841 RepID=A0ABR9CLJ4_9HYPH|nr:IclR family transcriptional regulator [Roseibium litorale]MBD8891727.1 IclR family transcriptional regulator [Roseibium litorale]
MQTKQNTLYVGSLAKGLKLLRAFDDQHTDLSLTDLMERTGLDKSATQRLANTLHVEGMLDKDPVTKRYRPSHAWLELAFAYYWADPVVGRTLPKLIELSQQLGETVNLAEMSGDHIIYVNRLPCKRTHFAATVIGRRLPALMTTSGRVMIATYPEEERKRIVETWTLRAFTPHTLLDREALGRAVEQAATDGYAVAASQMIIGELAIAAPIIGPDGRSSAAIQCSVSSHHYDEDRLLKEILPALRDTANSISPAMRQPAVRDFTPGL